ncbi:MAG: HAD hydrolase-like protein [Clostridia bacterium]|nr:HAD hydrolase-like protein [Clostridia bacterium]
MAEFDYILFDLDGTVSDSVEGITNSVMHAERRYGRPASTREELLKFVGPPLAEMFEKHLGVDREGGLLAVEYYREYYNDKGIFENRIYDGIEDVLKTLHDNGKTVLLATSKPEVYAVRILEHFGLAQYFDHICGALLHGRTDKAEVIEYALSTAGIIDRNRFLMVGDRMHDILGAKKTGLRSCGVLFGYGSLEELNEIGPDFIAETPMDILKFALM